MHRAAVAVAACLAGTALGFADTNPLFLVSTSRQAHLLKFANRSNVQISELQFADGFNVTKDLSRALSNCPSDVYVIASQPNAHASDFEAPDAAVHLGRRIQRQGAIQAASVVQEIYGTAIQVAPLAQVLRTACGVQSVIEADEKTGTIASSAAFPQLVYVQLSSLSSARPAMESDKESRSSQIAESGLGHRSYTLIYTGSRVAGQAGNAAKVPKEDLRKRSISNPVAKRDNSSDEWDAPLFEKYGFLNPAIFMGGITVLILVAIGLVGINALSGLEVSYAAFAKESGPASQAKKAQ